MPKLVITHALVEVERWLKGNPRAAGLVRR
jgi:hypothetical protein